MCVNFRVRVFASTFYSIAILVVFFVVFFSRAKFGVGASPRLCLLHRAVSLLRASVRTRVLCASVFIIVASFLSVSLSSHLQLEGTQVSREGVATPAANRHRCDITPREESRSLSLSVCAVPLGESCHPKTAIHTALEPRSTCIGRDEACAPCAHEIRLSPASLCSSLLAAVPLHGDTLYTPFRR